MLIDDTSLVIFPVLDRLSNPTSLEEYVRNSSPSPDYWDSQALSNGLPSGIILFSELDRLLPDQGWDDVVHKYILKLKESIEAEGISSPSMFSGLSGICFSIHLASKNGERYQKLLQKLEKHLLSLLKKAVSILEQSIAMKAPSRMEEYELISGITGMGSYFLARGLHGPLEKILSLLVARTKKIQVEKTWVPGWYVPCEYQFIERDKRHFPRGNFNLGMAHGISGVIALLSLSCIQGIVVNGQLEAIRTVGEWLIEKRMVAPEGIFWPSRISLEEEVSKELQKQEVSFDAWCYGTAGVARSLFLSGQALQEPIFKDIAIEGFEAVAGRKMQNWHLNTGSLCHGFAGTMLIMHLMARDTGFEWMQKSSESIKEALLGLYDENSMFGFKDFEPRNMEANEAIDFVGVEKVGLLDGVCGIFLALLTIGGGGTSWAAPFLIDGVDR